MGLGETSSPATKRYGNEHKVWCALKIPDAAIGGNAARDHGVYKCHDDLGGASSHSGYETPSGTPVQAAGSVRYV
jgi:hypothetical protein